MSEARGAFETLSFESMQLAEIQAMDARKLTDALFEVLDQLSKLGDVAKEATIHRAEAKKTVRMTPRTAENRAEVECALIDAQSLFDQTKDRIRAMKEYKSTLQTALRAVP